MARPRLRRLLQDWFRDQVETAPAGDRRRTPLCLRFQELEAAAAETLDLVGERAQHVRACPWCRRAVDLFRESAVAEEMSMSISLGLEGQWPAELRDCLARWLKKMAREDEGRAPAMAHFDDEGTFHMTCTGLQMEGAVKVSLMWDELELPLARGLARRGRLEIVEPMPHLGVRNVEIGQRLLRVRPEEAR